MYDLTRVRILVVESSEHMASIFRMVLSMLSVPAGNIDVINNADDAFVSYTRKIHDVIITDWMGNSGEGLEFVKMVRTNDESPNRYVPIIMSAGSGNLSRVIASRDVGVSEYLMKPFSAKDLAMRLVRVIEKPKPFIVSDNYVGHDRRVMNMSFDGEDRRKEEPAVHYE